MFAVCISSRFGSNRNIDFSRLEAPEDFLIHGDGTLGTYVYYIATLPRLEGPKHMSADATGRQEGIFDIDIPKLI